MDVGPITSSTRRMTLLTYYILSVLIVKIANWRTYAATSIFHSFCLFFFIITGKTSILILTSKAVISARRAIVINSEESTSTHTLEGFRINNLELINAAFLAVRVILGDNLTKRFWTFFKTEILINEGAVLTVRTYIFMLNFQSNEG